MQPAVLVPVMLALGAPLPTLPAGAPTVSPGEVMWRDADRPRATRRLAVDPASGRWRVHVRELDTGLEYPAEVGRRAIITDPPARLASLGLRAVRPLGGGLLLVEGLDAGEDGLALAARLAGGHTIMPDLYLVHRAAGGTASFDDPLLGSQWYVRKLGLAAAWAIEDGDPSVSIAINDNGCDLAHPDLAAQFVEGFDVIDDDGDPSYVPGAPGNEHGTACAGLVGAQGNNAVGIVGVCPGCKLRCVRLLVPPPGLVAISDDVQAFDDALAAGAAVSSNSWGFATAMTAPTPLVRAIRRFITDARGGLGGFVVFAAGNDNRALVDGEIFSIPGVLTVGAVNNFDEPTSFTNRGVDLDLAAPTGTFTTDVTGAEGHGPMDYFGGFGGTSSACPLVAGVLGLLVSAAPDKSADEIGAALFASLRPAPFATPGPDGHDLEHGYGLVDPAGALRILVPPPPDAGVPDVGEADGGDDAGDVSADGGVADDAGASAPQPASSCGCATSAPAEGALLLLMVLAVRRRR